VARGLMVAAQQVPQLASVFTTTAPPRRRSTSSSTASGPRRWASTCRHLLGAADGDGRHLHQRLQPVRPYWQVKVQAEAADRATVNDVYRVRVRSSTGELVALARPWPMSS